MTSKSRELYQHYVSLLKSDPVAKIAREAGNHDTRVSMLEALGLTITFAKRTVLTECRIEDPIGAIPHPATGDKFIPPAPGELLANEFPALIAYGASADAVDALEQALFGYCREAVQAKLA